MAEYINDIARLIDHPEVQVLSLEAAKSLLLSHTDPATPMMQHALRLEAAISGFSIGSNNIKIIREHAENLLEAVEDHLGLVSAITTISESGREGYADHDVAPLSLTKFADAVHNLMSLTRGYISGRCNGNTLVESIVEFSQICYNTYRNASILETYRGSDFCLDVNLNPNAAPIDTFNKVLVETVSCGAIGGAIGVRPAILGKKKRPDDIFPKSKKNRWYLRYAIE